VVLLALFRRGRIYYSQFDFFSHLHYFYRVRVLGPVLFGTKPLAVDVCSMFLEERFVARIQLAVLGIDFIELCITLFRAEPLNKVSRSLTYLCAFLEFRCFNGE
jgi:hypothetical protein